MAPHSAPGHGIVRLIKTIHDHLTPMPSRQLATLLTDLMPSTAPPPSPILPLGAHLVYFPPLMPASELAPDGADADHVPPGFTLTTPEDTTTTSSATGGRRLWVGGELTFRDGWASRLRLDGRPAVCVETIEAVTPKDAGRKTFVDIARTYGLSADETDIHERRTLCFVADDGATAPTAPKILRSPHQPTASYTFTPTPAHLFHFSALTYNAHFIHLDRQSALVHGPLILTLMLRALASQRSAAAAATAASSLAHFSYRNLAPLGVGQQTRVCVRAPSGEQRDGRGREMWDVWVEGPEGGMVARGRAHMSPQS
ncbi:hypothetical protein ACO1O0_008314 [Amphichorda felina]